ncbi:hypothetical protein OS493_030257, partial [Desmophyllum pertusum]
CDHGFEVVMDLVEATSDMGRTGPWVQRGRGPVVITCHLCLASGSRSHNRLKPLDA